MQQAIEEGVPVDGLQDDLDTASVLLEEDGASDDKVRDACKRLCAHYLFNEKRYGLPLDPVARFHLSNGAYLDCINFDADASVAGKQRSFGMMVNYVYKLSDIEKNHEAYFADGRVAASGGVRKLARA